jgi:hypothetical protein
MKHGSYETVEPMGKHLPLIIACLAILICAVSSALSGHCEQLIVSTPFLLLAVPGYWDLLPQSGMTHGHSCKCINRDAACELGFWFEHGQRYCLMLPVVLSTIFLGSIFFLRHDLREAVIETSLATLTAIVFLTVIAGCFYVIVHKFNKT